MTRDEIIRMALEAGFVPLIDGGVGSNDVDENSDLTENVLRFAALVAAAEREACIEAANATQSAETLDDAWNDWNRACRHVAHAIRARGEK